MAPLGRDMDVDAVVLDIDGVLVDTSASYRRAVIETLGTLYEWRPDPASVQAFKDAGGFNNDWLLTEAAALYALARDHGYDADLQTYTSAIENAGGGLVGAKDVLETALSPEDFETVTSALEPERIHRVFQWLYLGPDRYKSFEEASPPADRPSPNGFIDDETVLVNPETITTLTGNFPVGVHTGRPRNEAHIALDRVGLSVPGEFLVSQDDWDGGKPDPGGLRTIAERMGASAIAYAGDELDDVRTAVNADASDPDRRYYGFGVLTGGVTGREGAKRFRALGATGVLASIDELPSRLLDAGVD